MRKCLESLETSTAGPDTRNDAWHAAGEEVPKDEEAADEEEKEVQPIDLINETIFLNYFVVEGSKAKEKIVKEKEWDELMNRAAAKGREGDLAEAMRIIQQIKDEQEKFDAEGEDHVETEPLCSKGHKQLSAELDRMTNVSAAYLDKLLKHEKLASESKARYYAAVAAKAIVEKRIEDDRELKKKIEEQSKEQEADLDNAALPEEALKEIADLKAERETAEQALNSYQDKLAAIISKGKEKLKEDHKDGGPAKKAKQESAGRGEGKDEDMSGNAAEGTDNGYREAVDTTAAPATSKEAAVRARREELKKDAEVKSAVFVAEAAAVKPQTKAKAKAQAQRRKKKH